MTLLPETDSPARFAPGSNLVTGTGRALVVRSARPYRDRGLVVAFEGVTGREAAEALRGEIVTIGTEQRRDLEDGEYWVDELVGLRVVGPDGDEVGRIVGVAFGPQDRLVIDIGRGQIEVPFVHDLVGEPNEGTIVIDVPPGLDVRENDAGEP